MPAGAAYVWSMETLALLGKLKPSDRQNRVTKSHPKMMWEAVSSGPAQTGHTASAAVRMCLRNRELRDGM
jgi:hypothetical protein